MSFDCSKDLNILVGENNVGKTTIFIAVSKLINVVFDSQGQVFLKEDIRHNQLGVNPFSVSCIFYLDANDKRDVINLLSPKDFGFNAKKET